MYYLIYKITNKLNGKIYIGQHMTEDLNDGYMGSGVAIRRAIKKYGEENFSKEVLCFCTDWDTMNSMEEAIVNEAFVSKPETYNMIIGGNNGYGTIAGNSNKGRKHTPEWNRKIGEKSKGRRKSEEWKKKMSERMKGNHNNPILGKSNKGRKHSAEWNRKIGEKSRGRHKSEEHKRKISEALKGRPRTAS